MKETEEKEPRKDPFLGKNKSRRNRNWFGTNFTHIQWALLCSRIEYGCIKTNVVEKDGSVHKFDSRRQARKAMKKFPQSKLQKG